MVHSESAPHSTGLPSEASFSSRDWDLFHAEDRRAARNIVILMTAVFSFGLCGYLFIAYIVAP